MSFMLLGILNAQAAGGGLAYWLSTLGGASSDIGRSVDFDSLGNAYALGSSESSGQGAADVLLVKYDTLGAVQWQRTLGGASTDIGRSVSIDSSDNIYVAGLTASAGAGEEDFLLAKFNTSGTLQWQRVLGTALGDFLGSVEVDSSGNVYLAGYSANDFLLAKYNSSGTIQWQRTLGGAGSDLAFGVAIDSNDNPHIFGYTTSTGAGALDFLLAKYNSSGTIQWQRILGGAGNDIGRAVSIDSADNVYVTGRGDNGGNGNDFLIAKYNSSGTIQWQKFLGGTGDEDATGITLDSNDNLFVGGYSSNPAGDYEFLAAKYDTAGTIQWQRTLGIVGSNSFMIGIKTDSENSVYFIGQTPGTGAGGADFLLAKVANNGSLTGTYVLDGVNVVYAVSTLTAATATLTANTSSLTDSAGSLTSATSSLTSASASLTAHIVEL